MAEAKLIQRARVIASMRRHTRAQCTVPVHSRRGRDGDACAHRHERLGAKEGQSRARPLPSQRAREPAMAVILVTILDWRTLCAW